MLRIARSRHLKPLLTGAQFTNTGSDVTLSEGGADHTGSRQAQGESRLTFTETGALQRGPVVLATASDGGSDSVAAHLDSGSVSTTSYDVLTQDDASAGEDIAAHSLSLGFSNSSEERFILQDVKCTFPGAVLQAFHIDNPGSSPTLLSGGSQASVSRTGTGELTLSLSPAMARPHSVVACAVNAAAHHVQVASLTAGEVQLKSFANDGTATDTDIVVFLLAAKVGSRAGRKRANLQVPQQGPRLIPLILDTDGSVLLGGLTGNEDVTAVRNGAGDYSVTLSSPGKRACVPCATAVDGRCTLASAPTTSGFDLATFDVDGTQADKQSHILVVVYDSADEF